MLLKIYQTGQPVLREKAKKLTLKELHEVQTQQLIDSMIETLRDVPGVGLAAPQVGQSLRIFIIDDKAKYHKQVPEAVLKEQLRKPIKLEVLVNPEVEALHGQKDTYFEGCLSIDGYVGVVSRAHSVKVKALDRNGNSVEYQATGWHARILQHEIAHLNGQFYVDHMRPCSLITTKNFNDLWRDALQTKIVDEFGAS